MFRSLAHFNFRVLFIGSFVSNIGGWMQATAQDWVVLTHLTDGDAAAMGVTMALQFLPQLLLVPVTGWVADRFDRRRIMFVTQSMFLLLALALGVLLITNILTLPIMLCFALAFGLTGSFDGPARQAFVSDVVTGPNASNAVALNAAAFAAARMVGPAVGGLSVILVGPGWVFILNALTFLAMIAALLLMRPAELMPRVLARGPQRLSDGLRYVGRRPDLLVAFTIIFLISAFGMNFPIFASTMALEFGTGADGYGLLSSVLAIGTLAGALLAARRPRARLRIVVFSSALFGIASLLSSWMPVYPAYAISLIVVGFSTVSTMTTANGYVQSTADPAMRGRVMALYSAVIMGSTPIGAPIVGWAASEFGPRAAIQLGSAAGFVAFAIGIVWLIASGRVTRVAGRRRYALNTMPIAAIPPDRMHRRFDDRSAAQTDASDEPEVAGNPEDDAHTHPRHATQNAMTGPRIATGRRHGAPRARRRSTNPPTQKEKIVTNETAPASEILGPDPDWWRQAAVYQIYPRSFADANGDGIGDLRGILSRVPYLQHLGIDAVWLSPFYPSALADGGYDVDDYRDVDPKIGTLKEFDDLVAALHAVGIRVIVDLVPNHSSDRHVWFQEALASPRGSAARSRYLFRDGLGENGELPPSDWPSIFGGRAWTRVPSTGADDPGQWYLHLFAKEQPDFNWDNEEVREDFRTTLRFWADRGVDGFRVDVAHGLAKRLDEVLPGREELKVLEPGTHPYWDRDEVHEIYADWRRIFNEYAPPRVGIAEAWTRTAERRARYASPGGLGQAFNFDLLKADFAAESFRRVIAENLDLGALSGSSTTWVLSNHDVTRHATRYGLSTEATVRPDNGMMQVGSKAWLIAGAPEEDLDRERGLRRARAATLLELALPGSAYLYQGEELGLQEVTEIPDKNRQDPTFFRNPGIDIGRDGCRVPLPWTREGSSFGFGAGLAHLPQPSWFADFSVEAEEADPRSTLNLYREALRLRHELQTGETLEWVDAASADVLHFRRPNGWETVTNFGLEPVALPEGRIVLSSGSFDDTLPGETTIWIAP